MFYMKRIVCVSTYEKLQRLIYYHNDGLFDLLSENVNLRNGIKKSKIKMELNQIIWLDLVLGGKERLCVFRNLIRVVIFVWSYFY